MTCVPRKCISNNGFCLNFKMTVMCRFVMFKPCAPFYFQVNQIKERGGKNHKNGAVASDKFEYHKEKVSSGTRDRSRLSLKRKQNITWSQYRSQKEKSRSSGVKRDYLEPIIKVQDVSGKDHVMMSPDSLETSDRVQNFVRQDRVSGNSSSPELPDIQNIPSKRAKVEQSPDCVEVSTSSSSSSCRCRFDSSSNTSPTNNTSPQHVTSSGLSSPQKQKKFMFVKIDKPLDNDDELSDSLPDLEEISERPENDYFSSPPVLERYSVSDVESCNEISPETLVPVNKSCQNSPDIRNDTEKKFVIRGSSLDGNESKKPPSKYTFNLSAKLSKEHVREALSKTLSQGTSINNVHKSSVKEEFFRAQNEGESDSDSKSFHSSGEDRHFLDVLGFSPAKKIKMVSEDGRRVAKSTSPIVSSGEIVNQSVDIAQNKKQPDMLTNVDKTTSITTPAPRKFFDFIKFRQQNSQSSSIRRQYCLQKDFCRPARYLSKADLVKRNRQILYPSLGTEFALPEEFVGVVDHDRKFSAAQVNAIDAAMEDGECFMNHVIDLAQAFSLNNMPPPSVVGHVYSEGLLKSASMNQSYKAFNTLSFIQRKFPSAIRVEWTWIDHIMDKLGFGKASLSTDQCCIVNSCLALQLILQVFRGELCTIDLSDPVLIRKTQAYKVLSGDHELDRLKQLADWVARVLTSGEYDELCEAYINLQLEGDHSPPSNWHWPDCVSSEAATITMGEVKRVLPYLQQLLEIGVLVSSSNIDCARRLADKFVRVFYYLPNLEHKKLFLQTMSSDLLRFKLCQLFMEAHCDVAPCCTDFPPALQDVIECLFRASPPQSQHTPPTTPSEEDEFERNVPAHMKVSAESCEQLCMLLYYALCSYLKCAKSKFLYTLISKFVLTFHKHF